MKKIRFLLSITLLAAACLGAWSAVEPGSAKADGPVVLRVAEDGVGEPGCGDDWQHPCSLIYALGALPDETWVKASTYLFIGNSAINNEHPGFSAGGGMGVAAGQATLISVAFEQNQAASGGAIDSYNSDMQINGASFSGNTAAYSGGALFSRVGETLFGEPSDGHTSLLNTTFSGNQAGLQGGAVVNGGSELHITHSTVAGNTALGSGGGVVTDTSLTTITGSILWGNNPGQLIGSNTTVTYSDVYQGSGVWPGAGNLNADPRLGKLDHYGSALIQTLPPLTGSPAIDAVPITHCLAAQGTALVQDGRSAPRPSGAACDMGAHERNGTLSVFSGNGQATHVNTAFPLPLTVSLASAYQDPLDGVQVTFDAPGSGASALVSSAPLLIANGGTAGRAAQANAIAGSYHVSVTAPGINPAFFNLTNILIVHSMYLPILTR